MSTTFIVETPWDSAAFGIFTGELQEYSEEALRMARGRPGHYTLKVDPLSDKRLLTDFGFYYCDTLIEPWCGAADLRRPLPQSNMKITREVNWTDLLKICHGSFVYGRFHRDFNLSRADSDSRYDNWLRQLHKSKDVYGLILNEELVGFIACSGNALVLHAMSAAYRGRNIAKYGWDLVCFDLFSLGHKEVKSSVSAANVAVVNLYASLGFRFRNPKDIYHLLVK